MITAVYLNPCIDKTVEIEKFEYGGMNRVLSSRSNIGGKGVNVSALCKRLDMDARCAGILYSQNGSEILKHLQNENIVCDFIWRDGAVRVNTKLFDRSTHITSEINEPGIPCDTETIQEIFELVVKKAATSDYVVLTGSIPPGCPKDIYANLIESCGKEKCILDAEGQILLLGAQKAPFVVKCNQYELELACQKTIRNKNEVCAAAGKFLKMGAKIVIVTMGKEGLIALCEDDAVYAGAPEIRIMRTVGAGDAVTSGFIKGITQNLSFRDCVRSGVAAAAGAIVCNAEIFFDYETYQNTLGEILIQEI